MYLKLQIYLFYSEASSIRMYIYVYMYMYLYICNMVTTKNLNGVKFLQSSTF